MKPVNPPITAETFGKMVTHDNAVGVVDVHPDHVLRVAEIMSERFPGIVFMWGFPDEGSISAIRADRRQMGDLEEDVVMAAEKIAENVSKKRPPRTGFFARWFRKPLRPGWHFTPKPVRTK